MVCSRSLVCFFSLEVAGEQALKAPNQPPGAVGAGRLVSIRSSLTSPVAERPELLLGE